MPKKEVWKADMDGEVDVTNKHIKKAIEDAMSEMCSNDKAQIITCRKN